MNYNCVFCSSSSISLAGLRISVPIRLRRKPRKKIPKVKYQLMDFWHKMIFPVRRVWLALSSRLKARRNGNGLLKLQDDVQTCGYQDIQVMWEMLRRTESEVFVDSHQKRKQQPFWGIFVWPSNNSNHAHASLESSKSS